MLATGEDIERPFSSVTKRELYCSWLIFLTKNQHRCFCCTLFLITFRQSPARGTTVSALVESALRAFLDRVSGRPPPPPLETFDGGGCVVDVADRDALYRAMEGR